MIKTVFNKLLIMFYYVVGALILEFVTFNILNLGVAPEYYLSNLAIIFIIALLVYAVPNFTAQYVIYTIILAVQTIFIYVNFSLYKIYGDLFSFDMMRLIGEAGAAITTNFVYFSVILQLIAVMLSIAIVGAILLHICKKDKIKLKQHYSIFNIIILLGIQCFALGYYVHQRNYINELSEATDASYVNSDTFLMNTSFLKSSSYAKFGTYGYFFNLIANSIFDYSNRAVKTATLDYFNNGEVYNSSDVFGVDEGNNVIVIMMESLEWFGFGDGNYDKEFNNLSNELTPNVYALIYGDTDAETDDGLIMKNFYAKSKTNYSEGIGIIGNYPASQNLIDVVKKDKNKQQNIFGYSMPNVLKSKGYTTTYLHSHDLDFYDRANTHNYIGFDTIIGKDRIKDEYGHLVYSDLEFDHWAPEEDIVGYTMDYIIPKNYQQTPFYSFYLNVSSHGPYTDIKDENKYDSDYFRFRDYVKYGKDNCKIVKSDGTAFTFEGQELTSLEDIKKHFKHPDYVYKCVDDSSYSNWYTNVLNNYEQSDPNLVNELLFYECGVVGMDTAIGDIVAILKNNLMQDGSSLFEHTTMVLYADHYAYYPSEYGPLSNRFKNLNHNDFYSTEVSTIPFIISSPGLKKKNTETLQADNDANIYTINTRFCSAYDIIPTVFDLLGVPFNENFYMGNSLFKALDYKYPEKDKDMVIYYSNTGGMFGSEIYTYNLKDFYSYTNDAISNETIEVFKAEANTILTKLNYLHILNNQLLYNQLTNI